jgi:hypothetical protein
VGDFQVAIGDITIKAKMKEANKQIKARGEKLVNIFIADPR